MSRQDLLPFGSAFFHVPRMVTERRDDLRILPGDGENRRPVLLTRTIDHHPDHAAAFDCRHDIGQMRSETFVLQMVVGVVKQHAPCVPGFRKGQQREIDQPVSPASRRASLNLLTPLVHRGEIAPADCLGEFIGPQTDGQLSS